MTVQDGGWKHGGFWRISDRSGKKYRNYDTRREWNGLIVGNDEFEVRQPQDFVRGVADKQIVDSPRPRAPVDTFVGPLVTELTAAAVPGDIVLQIANSTRMIVGDEVDVLLDNGTLFTSIFAITSATSITVLDPIPSPASVGNQVIDRSAVAAANIG